MVILSLVVDRKNIHVSYFITYFSTQIISTAQFCVVCPILFSEWFWDLLIGQIWIPFSKQNAQFDDLSPAQFHIFQTHIQQRSHANVIPTHNHVTCRLTLEYNLQLLDCMERKGITHNKNKQSAIYIIRNLHQFMVINVASYYKIRHVLCRIYWIFFLRMQI